MNGDWLVILQARTKILALQHARQPIVRTKAHDVFGGHFAEPFAVVANFGFVAIENFVNLREIRLGIGVDLLARQRRARFRNARGVANHRRKIANQENSSVAKVLKVFELAEDYRVAEMNVRGRGVDAEIHTQRLPGFQRFFEFGFQFGFWNDFGDAFFQVGELFFDRFEFCWRHKLNSTAPKHAPAGYFVFSFQDNFNRFGIDAMLLFENRFGEGGFRIFVEYGNSGLHDDRAGVEILVNEVDRAAGEFYAIFEGLALRFQARERRKQRRVNIQDAIRKFGDEIGREQAHVPGEADELDSVLGEDGGHLTIVDFAFETF